jgi:subtilisin-like proprotein convertase family protein
MRKWLMYLGLGLLLIAAAWFFWPRKGGVTAKTPGASATTAVTAKNAVAAATATNALPTAKAIALSAATTNRFTFRLSNTTKSIKQLTGDRHAILLENAFIDTSEKVDLKIPTRLQAAADPGAYIVQANGLIDANFRALLAAAGAQIVSYIPNNAFLVRLTASGAGALQADARVQAVLPYQPYYKISATIPAAGASAKTASAKSAKKSQPSQPTLLQLAVEQKPLPSGTFLTLGLFADTATATIAQIEKLGGKILSQDRSPFGELVHVAPPADWIALANLPGVQLVEPAHQRKHMNDLSRQTLGVSVDSVNATNYLNLTGKNVMVEVNDTGIDQNHPDLTGRIFGDFPGSLLDTDGHGTFVAGEIAGSGLESITVTNASGSINPGTNFQYRGKAPLASLFSVGGLFNEDGETGHDTNAPISDSYFQEQPALTNALISNNSWVNEGDMAYDLSAASYDAAVRDALPEVTGPQPVLFVFAAGNDGSGGDDGADGGNPDSIDSPGTAKDVITVGSLEQARFITNTVTTVVNGTTNTSQLWLPETSSAYDVAGYSSRGNVGIGTEGTYGRYKPDVVAPGTFVVSTRSTTWDTNVYYNPTNYSFFDYTFQLAPTNDPVQLYSFLLPPNAVSLTIQIFQNSLSPLPFPTNLPLYISLTNSDVSITNSYDITSTTGTLSIPPLSGGSITNIGSLQGNLFNVAVANNTTNNVNYDLEIIYATTNDVGDENQQLQNLNDNLGKNPQYYRYETGTSMAAAEVSGVLALMQDFFTNTLHTTPSPALLKALLINGARPTAYYDFQVQNAINYQGWGLVNLPDSIPSSFTNTTASPTSPTSFYYADQSATNALATGDSQTYKLTISPDAQSQSSPLHITLAWTDPPGNPAAAIKLVNNLNLVVSNLDNPAAPVLYYGNDIAADNTYNTPEGTNTPVVLDAINNVQNVFIQSATGTNFSITVFGTAVNVNAVTTQTNNNVTGTYAPNIVQDYALVVSSGGSSSTNGFTITPMGVAPNPTDGQRITDVTSTNSPLLNQFVGASSPDVATNQTSFASGSPYANDAVVSIGQTNQWHFYIVTNNATDSAGLTADVTNAAFVTFSPDTAAIPREGVFAGSDANSTRPEADVDVFVSTDPSLTNLNPLVISNCINGPQVGASIGSAFNGSSLSRGGSEYVVDTNSTSGQVYYVGVQSQDQMGSEYGFVSLFSSTPFSTMDTNGNQTVQFFPGPVSIPDGSSTLAGTTNVIGLALYPITVQRVIVTNTLVQQNVGDLVVSLGHSSVAGGNGNVILLNHDAPNSPGTYTYIYDDSGQGDITNSQPSDGPGASLQTFATQQGNGVWIMTAADNAPGFVGTIQSSLQIQPHRDLGKQPFVTVAIAPNSWFYGYVQVPVGTTSLTVVATNVSGETPGDTLAPIPLGLYVKDGSEPTLTDFDETAGLTNSPSGLPFPTGPDPGNSISIGPPITPGIYYVGVYNPNAQQQEVLVGAYLPFNTNAIATVTYDSTDTPIPLLDDAVTTDSIFVTNTDIIQGINVGLRVDHPRISDLAFTLISPDGSRYLLMENRGGTSTNGCGVTVYTTNDIANFNAAGTTNASTNIVIVSQSSGTLPISWNFFRIADQMTVYDTTNNFTPANLIFDTGMTNGVGQVNLPFTTVDGGLTIIINQFGNTNGAGGDAWNYTAGGVVTNYYYLDFTEDTNLTTTPIKFAPTPFVPTTTNSALPTPPAGVPVLAGPILNPANGHYYYLLGNTNWTTSETWAKELGGHLATVNSTAENNWITSNFMTYGGVNRDLWIGLYDPFGDTTTVATQHATNFMWISGAPLTYTNWYPGEPNNGGGVNFEYYGFIDYFYGGQWQDGQDVAQITGKTELQYGVAEVGAQLAATGNLYYQPEQSLQPLIGTSAQGLWKMEILDNRAGAGLTNSLDSWQLQFIFANTNYTLPPPIILLTNDVPVTNTITTGCTVAGGSFTWYQVNVPINVDSVTNFLLSADLPLNVWFSPNNPPTTNGTGDTLLIADSTGTNVILSTNGPPPNIVPGGTYYLGVQNLNCTNVNYAIEVGFHFSSTAVPFAFTQPATLVSGTSAQLNGMATPNGFPTYAWFEWGTNTLYGNQTTITSIGSGNNVVYVTNATANLITRLPYHFRLVVSNGVSVVRGFDQILDNANEVAWGAGYIGQTAFQPSLTNYNVTAVAGAYDHSMALMTNGTILVWGDNTYGQTNVPSNVTNVVAIAGGQYYSMALLDGGTVAAWGGTVFGTPTNVPSALTNPVTANVVAIAGGTYAETALRNDGTVMSWGINAFNLTNVPPGLSNVVAVAGGGFHNLAIKNDGTVTGWGDNSDGQLNIPAGLSNVVAIAAGEFYSLALQSNGTVVAWGDDSVGQTNVPLGLSNVVAIAAGGFHCIALKSNGTMVFWGDDSANQANAPAGLTNVVAISAGYLHSLALTTIPIPSLLSPGLSIVSNGVPQTNTLIGGGIYFYEVNVPTNVDMATNFLLFADNLPLNISWTTNVPPTIGGPNDAFLFSGTNGFRTLSTNGIPPLVPGGTYYLGVDNTNAVSVTYGIEVNFHFITASTNTVPPLTNTVPISSIIHTNINGTNGFLLTWFAPSNDLFQVQWTASLLPASWQTFTNIISYNTSIVPVNPTNAQFNFFDDGSQTGGFGPTRFYRLILTNPSAPSSTLALPNYTNFVAAAGGLFTVTNTATDSRTGVTLTYTLTNAPTVTPAPTISTNGIITWTPPASVTNTTYTFTTVVTDTGSPQLSATNSFTVLVATVPTFSGVTVATNGVNLQWLAPTNEQFKVQWTTNLVPVINWFTFPGILTSTNGTFSFTDTNTPMLMKFYRLLLLP